MGPHSSEQGNNCGRAGTLASRPVEASMGPHSSEQGNGDVVNPALRLQRAASMGPHSSEQGNLEPACGNDSQGNASMGPHVPCKETTRRWRTSTEASMGPHSSEQGNFAWGAITLTIWRTTLQWGLTLPSKETCTESLERGVALHTGFNGASLFRARKREANAYDDRRRWIAASMGPHSSEQGNAT